MHFNLLGVGAIGTLLATKIIKNSHTVDLIFKDHKKFDQFLAPPNNSTLQLTPFNSTTAFKANFNGLSLSNLESQESALNKKTISYLIITTKSYQTKKAFELIRPYLKTDAVLIFLQNGVGQIEEIPHIFTDFIVYQAITTHGVYKTKPFNYVHAGEGSFYIGLHSKSKKNPNQNNLISALNNHFELSAKIENLIYKKLIVNCAINPLTAILNCKNGYLSQSSEIKELVTKICFECCEVLNQCTDTKIDLVEMTQFVFEVVYSTKNNNSSMQQDVINHCTTEIEYLNGAIIKLANNVGLKAPINETLTDIILAKNLT